MENNKQITAVEWLWRWQMDNEFASFEEAVSAYRQAKEMEESEILKAYSKGYENALKSMTGGRIITDKDYYEEIYGK